MVGRFGVSVRFDFRVGVGVGVGVGVVIIFIGLVVAGISVEGDVHPRSISELLAVFVTSSC